ncbi:MAG: hypothetical protein SGI83_09990 [Bacteroidota bacterium]|nr:hypothetical protein [Bacteroidota bacterium]
MKFLLPPSLLACLLVLVSFAERRAVSIPTTPVSPLASYSTAWNDVKYLKCNTAASANYMSTAEKEVIYILNLARTNPALFANTVIKKYPAGRSHYYSSLLDTMLVLKQVKLLYPDSLCFAGALCHAQNSGKEGYVGHTRSTEECRSKWYYNGECCDYGHNRPLDIIMSLLIDEGVESLGHRKICLAGYKKIGVSIQPHTTYGHAAVLDFHY